MTRTTLATRLLTAAALLTLTTSCVRKQVDRFTAHGVVPEALEGGDLYKTCALGESLSYALSAVPRESNPPHRALVIGEATAALCFEMEAWEAELDAERARHNFADLGDSRAAEIKDARLKAERAHALAADRFWRSFGHLEAAWGPAGETCPRIARDDEFTYLLALVAGVNALFHDRKSGGQVGVPLDTILRVGRAAQCLDNERWWHAPMAMQAGAWGTIPGSAPEGVDPWALLETEAAAGGASGVRVGWALAVLVRANAGRTDEVEAGIHAQAESLKSVEQDPAWVLLDEYARRITLHESDLIWTAAEGHRTPSFGALPSDAKTSAPAVDPFGADDPFGEDPFGEAPAAPATPPEE